jgi:hypothetical protein
MNRQVPDHKGRKRSVAEHGQADVTQPTHSHAEGPTNKILYAALAVVIIVLIGAVACLAYLKGQQTTRQIVAPIATNIPVVATSPSASPSPSITPTPGKAGPTPRASIKTVYVKSEQTHQTRSCSAEMRCVWGTFPLTRLARPGPIHVYAMPSDTSDKIYPVYANGQVSVYCSVRGQNLQGHDYWDWVGDGWVWDRMVDAGGLTPPRCEYDEGDY